MTKTTLRPANPTPTLSAKVPCAPPSHQAWSEGASRVSFITMTHRIIHDTLGQTLNGVDLFTKHAAQMNEQLKRVAAQQHAEREAAAAERQRLEERWLKRLRITKIEAALNANMAARNVHSAGKALKLWAAAVHILSRESLSQRREHEQQLQLRLRDSGREELLHERQALSDRAAKSALEAQELRMALQQRSMELERSVQRETMSLQQQAADAARTSQVLKDIQRQHEQVEGKLQRELATAHADLEQERASSAVRSDRAEGATALVLKSEVGTLEFGLRVRAASQIVVVRLAVQQGVLHRFWKAWAVVASVLLREAGGAMLQLELAKQQQRGVHTRLQQELAAELAQSRVENLEARAQLAKAEILDSLEPGHELVTDKEMVQKHRRALQAANESAASAQLAAAAHRVGEAALIVELKGVELKENSAPGSPGPAEKGGFGQGTRAQEQRVRQELEQRLRSERAASEQLQAENASMKLALQRAKADIETLKGMLEEMRGQAQQEAEEAEEAAAALVKSNRSNLPARQRSPSPRPSGDARPGAKPPQAKPAARAKSPTDEPSGSKPPPPPPKAPARGNKSPPDEKPPPKPAAKPKK